MLVFLILIVTVIVGVIAHHRENVSNERIRENVAIYSMGTLEKIGDGQQNARRYIQSSRTSAQIPQRFGQILDGTQIDGGVRRSGEHEIDFNVEKLCRQTVSVSADWWSRRRPILIAW